MGYSERNYTTIWREKNAEVAKSETQKFSNKDNSYINFNQLNGEREIEFYYPQLNYSYLPNELIKVPEVGANKMVEVAVSFKQPLSLKEVSNILGADNVKWLWVDTTTESQINQFKKEAQKRKEYGVGKQPITQSGKLAYGFQLMDSDFKVGGTYFLNVINQLGLEEIANSISGNASPTINDIRISGAVVVGTPEELERFSHLDIIRVSLIGATIDIY